MGTIPHARLTILYCFDFYINLGFPPRPKHHPHSTVTPASHIDVLPHRPLDVTSALTHTGNTPCHNTSRPQPPRDAQTRWLRLPQTAVHGPPQLPRSTTRLPHHLAPSTCNGRPRQKLTRSPSARAPAASLVSQLPSSPASELTTERPSAPSAPVPRITVSVSRQSSRRGSRPSGIPWASHPRRASTTLRHTLHPAPWPRREQAHIPPVTSLRPRARRCQTTPRPHRASSPLLGSIRLLQARAGPPASPQTSLVRAPPPQTTSVPVQLTCRPAHPIQMPWSHLPPRQA